MLNFKKVPDIGQLVEFLAWGTVHNETRFRLRAVMRLVASPVIRRIRNEDD